VGATPDELRSEGHDVIEGTVRFPETGRAITMGSEHGLWKLFADRRSREILGSTCLGPRADDLIHLIALIMRYRGTIDEILDQPWYHPTLSEVILNAARDLRGQCS